MSAAPLQDNAYFDVVIAGGGMVGVSLALLLSEFSANRCRLLVVESFAIDQSAPLTYTPSFDARATALSYGSRQLLEASGLWATLEHHATAIESIHVSQRGRFGSTLMDKAQMHWPALGYVVENQWLGNVLLGALRQRPNVTFLSPAKVSTINCGATTQLQIAGTEQVKNIEAGLVVVADGAQSDLRRKLGIDVQTKTYQQSAIIANVCFRRPHAGRAYERFTAQGPVALLPLSASEAGEPRAALVWSMEPEMAEATVALGDAGFLAALQRQFGHRQGEFTRVGRRDCYPLALVQAQEQARRGVVVMGNAAHSLHPVAGQGFNLALRDCARLAHTVSDALREHRNPGELASLQAYVQQQMQDQQFTTLFSDRLPALFGLDFPPLGVMRDIGLGMLDVLPAAKAAFIQRTAGTFDGSVVGDAHGF